MRSVARRISDRKMLALVKAWLKAPVEERDEKGNRRLTGGKGSHLGTPQGGVVSPLLANIYMRRFLLAWEQRKLPEKLSSHVVNYADDFVILCRKTAWEAKTEAEKIITGIKLQLNQEKTRVVNAWREPFDFLGYTFGLCYEARMPKPYLGAKPSKKRIKRINERVREYLHRGNIEPLDDVIEKLRSVLFGWANYFSYGTLSKAYRAVDYAVRVRFRWWLCKRHKIAGRGTRQFPDEKLYGDIGLPSLQAYLAVKRSQARGETSPRAGCGKPARPVR